MEINEGNVRVYSRPVVTIGDKTLDELCNSILGRTKIARELIALAKTVAEQRETIFKLEARNATD
jgi:hypothetical protein